MIPRNIEADNHTASTQQQTLPSFLLPPGSLGGNRRGLTWAGTPDLRPGWATQKETGLDPIFVCATIKSPSACTESFPEIHLWKGVCLD